MSGRSQSRAPSLGDYSAPQAPGPLNIGRVVHDRSPASITASAFAICAVVHGHTAHGPRDHGAQRDQVAQRRHVSRSQVRRECPAPGRRPLARRPRARVSEIPRDDAPPRWLSSSRAATVFCLPEGAVRSTTPAGRLRPGSRPMSLGCRRPLARTRGRLAPTVRRSNTRASMRQRPLDPSISR